jgi:hypothetical protein
MLTKGAVAAEALPAAAGLDETAVPGGLADPEDPQPASETTRTARTASATAGFSSASHRVCLIASTRPMDAPPSRRPHYSQ